MPTNLDAVREVIHRGFDHVDELGGGILRGERRYQNKPFVVAYIDLADEVVARSKNLTAFQEKLLGSSFFSPDSDLRWNSYLYFLAGPKSTHDADYQKAKSHIESDRHFARKFVVTAEDLSQRFGAAAAPKSQDASVQKDAGATWAELLRAGELGVLLEQRPRTRALELISSGAAFKVDTKSVAQVVSARDDPLKAGLLRSLTIGRFRPVNEGKTFQFGDVNLIFGANGTGKTSLLEAIEALYCGRVRRDPDVFLPGLQSIVESPTGKRIDVKGTTSVAILKARNLSWYGRPDPLSSTISQGFTRFNFLDTDAAFRLSSEPDPERIKEDLGKLLVGAETSKLWNYLSKLDEELQDKLSSLEERLPTLRSQAALLSDEVKRLRDTPSEASVLAKAYRFRLGDLGAKWRADADAVTVNLDDRTQLESLSKNIEQALLLTQMTPVTLSVLRERSLSLHTALAGMRRLGDERARAIEQLNTTDRLIQERQEKVGVLEQWLQYCEANVPAITESLQSVKSRIAPLRIALGGVTAETIAEVPSEYATAYIEDAVIAARTDLDKAVLEERSATEAFVQRQRLDQSLGMLRRDLHDVAVALVEKTGDKSACPICRTPHVPTELLAKIEALISTEEAAQSGGLRQAIQDAKARVDEAQRTVALIATLLSYSKARGASGAISCTDLRAEFLQKHIQLNELLQELARLNVTTDSLDLTTGLEWARYEPIREAARQILPSNIDSADGSAVAKVLESLRSAQAADSIKRDEIDKNATELMVQIGLKFDEVGLSPQETLTPVSAITLIERASKAAEDALAFVVSAAEKIAIADEQPLEILQGSVSQALVALEKASFAALGEEQARSDLKKKKDELEQVNATLAAEQKAEKNYLRAKAVLSPLVTEHSIDKATKEALFAIKGQVSEVFARIHSPQQYELGDFEDGRFLLDREKKQPHGVDRVSTGQRAAFALSIFLALNMSANSIPPIVLIDDPVAHVDDLNALSFLDYLRDLVMRSGKQIFFASADARLAALFQRKFEFLGEERFKKIVLSHRNT